MIVRTIGELIKDQVLVTVSRQATVSQACEIMSQKNVGALVVMDEIGMCGILSERDVIQRCETPGAPADLMRVDAIMTPKPETVEIQQSLTDALVLMIDGGFRHLPVVEACGKAVGMVSMHDIPTEFRLMVQRFSAYRALHAAE